LCCSAIDTLIHSTCSGVFAGGRAVIFDTRQACDHFRGEPWNLGDEREIKGRREFILESIKEYCTGTDKQLAELRRKYADNPKIIERLQEYEDHIEAR
jgi:hypothetical protein